MDEELIIVDDIDVEAQPVDPTPLNASSLSAQQPHTSHRPLPERASASRLRSASSIVINPAVDNSERTTRSATMRPKIQPKLKLKLSEKAAAQAPGMSFLGPYDRELDSDEEELGFEEHFVLRMPLGEDLEKLRRMVQTREIANDVWFKFKDSRRAVFHIGANTYSAKLVDLPCIIESQKTLDNKQMFKAADICQMLVLENKIENDEQIGAQKNFNIDEFIWPHGITPPLHHTRKRRFRKRVNRRTIESVEEQVERLLDEDALAAEVKYEVLENVNPDLSDSEFIEREEPLDAPTPAISDQGDAATPREDMGEVEDDYEGEENEDEIEGDIDEELAAELDLALGDELGGGNDDEEDEEEESEEEDSEDEDDEDAQARKLLNEEIRDLEAAVAKKNNEIASSANPLIRKRFEDALKKLATDLEMKLAQRDELKEKQRMKKEGININAADDTDPETAGDQDGEVGREEDPLFGSDEPDAMEMA